MSDRSFHDQLSLEEQAVELGKKAMAAGLIPSFTVHYYPDTWQFSIPVGSASEPLTPEEAYMQLQRILDIATQ
ncbi:hypothetical protein IQ268_20220 [Oculatella sp. LEGE 06141]|uniref:hypothetical protein n=1 Tax=Oculatella sp. LEGE 06141 TaxID=1828648 RepID=UPI00187F8ED2|nr:hypothetical protein [Oculatella sp. LEGE 06141]MBE9180889.1 hypothetical protein [Oculatella sp. LEGE 06141]